ncbi:chorismate-binding protein [Streptomyces sp. NPDC006923]|uniref:chorismate-binding protein n=1 Tax=Streptomyces sp. NPDC006923 TaxID=3155355 RepID=UPI0033CE86FF
MVSPPCSGELVGRLLSPEPPPFALLRRVRADTGRPGPVELFLGEMVTVDTVDEIPAAGTGPGPRALALLPFRQLAERGIECHDDGTPLRVLRITESHTLDRSRPLAALPALTVTMDGAGFETDDARYAGIVRDMIAGDVAEGGLSCLIRRDFTARLRDFRPALALELFRRLLTAETGAYWTFVVHTGGPEGRTLVGATPQGHVRIEDAHVTMDPMCGTHRYPPEGPDVTELLSFLDDRKESDELAMTVDAELALLSGVAGPGVRVDGPHLRPMAHLVHSTCRISGPTGLTARRVLARAMFASTAVGSPYADACRVIRRREPGGRGYYGGALALIGRDASGREELDSAAVIRTLDIDHRGGLRLSVGATVGPDSSPADETAETHTKAAGLLGALGADGPRPAPAAPPDRAGLAAVLRDGRVARKLAERRGELSPFWADPARPDERGRWPGEEPVTVIDTGGDDTAALAYFLRGLGADTVVRRYDKPGLATVLTERQGPVVLASGPGRPDDLTDRRIRALHDLAAALAAPADDGCGPLAGIGLGFQLLVGALGLAAVAGRREKPVIRRRVTVFDRTVTAAFRNGFAVRASRETSAAAGRRRVSLWTEPGSGEIVALRGPGVGGFQFRPESVLTRDGAWLLRTLLRPWAGSGHREGPPPYRAAGPVTG